MHFYIFHSFHSEMIILILMTLSSLDVYFFVYGYNSNFYSSNSNKQSIFGLGLQ